MAWTRREFLRVAGAAGALPVLHACMDTTGEDGDDAPTPTLDCDPGLVPPAWEGEPAPEGLFAHGVASGDPLVDSVVLWTRVRPEDGAAVEVYVEVATDPDFACLVAAGTAMAEEVRDHTVKIDVTGLIPATTFYYRFHALGRVSPVGRTRTAPQGAAERLRFGVCSCSNHAYGYFHAYRAMAQRADLDAVLHLGDYIYEYGTGTYGDVRPCDPPTEILTLEDYRRRYAQYRSDPDLQEVHRQHPFVVTWDDHESANNSWRGGAENHDAGEGDWLERVVTARRAWFEWIPAREGAAGTLYRRLAYGDLVDLIVLDTRVEGRDEQSADPEEIWREDRQLLGAEQEAWLLEALSSSPARWKILLNQVILCGWYLNIPETGRPSLLPATDDNWAGYAQARERVLRHLVDEGIDGVVAVTGDVHTSWANEVPVDPSAYDPDTGAGSACVEAVCPGITSPGGFAGLETFLMGANPHIRWGETASRGFFVLDVTRERVQADWFLLPDGAIDTPAYVAPEPAMSLESAWGLPVWVPAEGARAPDAEAPALAP